MAVDISCFLNVKKKFTFKGVSYEFGKRLVLPKVRLYGAKFKLTHIVNGQEKVLWINNDSLASLMEYPDFEIKGEQVISPITLLKDNCGKPNLIMIGSDDYDKLHIQLSSNKDLKVIQKEVRYNLKANESNLYPIYSTMLMSGKKIGFNIHNYAVPNQVKEDLFAGELQGIYLGKFTVSHINIFFDLTYQESSEGVMVFYLPSYDDFLIVPNKSRKWFAIKKSSKQDLPDKDKMFVGRIDLLQSERFFSNFFGENTRILDKNRDPQIFLLTKKAQLRFKELMERPQMIF